MKGFYKTILITGASSGLGRALALEYANSETILFLNSRNKQKLTETAKLCEDKGARVIFKDIDIKERKKLEKWILSCDKISNIDLIIANAGISSGTSNESGKFSKETYDVFETNVFGTLNTIVPIIPRMIERGRGQIALVSSLSSFIGMASCPAYSSSKACISAYGEGLRGYLKQYGVGISIICPGFIKTPLTDKNNFIMPMIMDAEKASKIIVNGISKNKGLIAFPFTIYFILKILRFLPFNWTNYIFSKLPKK